MPIYKVQGPDGKIHKFEGPAGATPEQITAFARQQFGQTPTEKPSLPKTILDQGLQGATFGFADEITDRIGAGIASLTTGEKYGDLLDQARVSTKDSLQNQLQERPVASILSQLGGGILSGGGLASKIPTATGLAGRVGQGVASGAASGALYGAGTGEEGTRTENAVRGGLLGGAVGGALPLVTSGATGLLNAAIPKVDDATKELASAAKDIYGIPLRASEVTDSVPAKIAGTVTDKLPFSGANKFKGEQLDKFYGQVAKTIGQDATDLGPETIKKFTKDASQKFNTALEREYISFTPNAVKDLDNIVISAEESIDDGLAAVVKKNVKKLQDVISVNGAGGIQGEKIASIRSEILKNATRAQGGSKEFLSDLVDYIDDAVEGSLPKDKVKVLETARREWRNYKTIQPLLEKSTDGRFTPSELMNRVAASPYIKASSSTTGKDPLVDLARIGKKFLKQQSPSSGTAENLLYMMGAPAALLNPATAASIGGGLALGRGVQSLNSNQKIVDLMIKNGGLLNLPQAGLKTGLLTGAVAGNQ